MTNKSDFDQYAEQYDRVLNDTVPRGLNEDGYFAEYKIALMAACLKKNPPQRILDFGCGAGRSLPYLEQFFPDAELYGYDVSLASLKVATERVPHAKLFCNWSDISMVKFDVIVAANVFHHILPEDRQLSLRLCQQSLSDNGTLFLFEHNPYNPCTRWIFEHCPFDAGAKMLSLKTALNLAKQAGFSAVSQGYALFFPRPLAFLRGLEPFLKHLPLGAQYYVKMYK